MIEELELQTVDTKREKTEEDRIRELAYELWLARGQPIGTPEVDWFTAIGKLGARS